MPSFRESVLEQYGRDYACLECVLEFPTEYKAVAHFSYVHNAVEESGRLPHRFGTFHIVDILYRSFFSQISHCGGKTSSGGWPKRSKSKTIWKKTDEGQEGEVAKFKGPF